MWIRMEGKFVNLDHVVQVVLGDPMKLETTLTFPNGESVPFQGTPAIKLLEYLYANSKDCRKETS